MFSQDLYSPPFPWFGGKRRIAPTVWEHFGRVENYVEPFFGSGAVLFSRPTPFSGNETINDLDGFVANFWRAMKHAPEIAAEWADNPVNENDLHARHAWLLEQRDCLVSRLEGDPEWCDPRIAGWWVWGICCWIGSGFCSGKGPWRVIDLGNAGRGVNRAREELIMYFQQLAERLRQVRVCSGDWSRVCGPSVTFKHGTTAVLLDPPYGEEAKRRSGLYRRDDAALSKQVREWALMMGRRSDMRIALCGYEGEHSMPEDWNCIAWAAGDGYGVQADVRTGNGDRERIWFSPACRRHQAAFKF